MIFSLLPHFLGVCCVLYALQLVYRLYQDVVGKPVIRSLVSFAAGIAAALLAVGIVLFIDYLYPVGSALTSATLFVRVSFLVPLSYIAAAFTSFLISSVAGKLSANIVQYTALLGITLAVLAPIAAVWLGMGLAAFAPGS